MNIADFYFPAQNAVQKIYSRIGLAVVGDGNPSPTPSGETDYFAITADSTTAGVKFSLMLYYCNVENATPAPPFDLWISTDKENWTQADITPEYYYGTETNPFDGSTYYLSTEAKLTIATLNGGDTIYLKGTNPNGLSLSNGNDTYMAGTSFMFMFDNVDEESEEVAEITLSGNLCTMLEPTGNVTTIPENCFSSLFAYIPAIKHCTAYVTATEVESGGLLGTLQGCENLEEGLDLRTLTTCADGGLDSLYNSCTNLATIYAPCPSYWEMDGFTNPTPFKDWVYGVAESGTFYAPAGLQIPTGGDGMPRDWTRVDY